MLITKNNPLDNNKGVTLLEILIVLIIVSFLAGMGGVTLSPSIDRRKALNCSSRMITTIQQIRSQAQSVGNRTVFKLTGNATAQDLDGDGNAEYFIGFTDLNGNTAFDPGETVFVHGSPGDQLCSARVSIDQANTTTNTVAFEPLGFLLGTAANKNIYFSAGSTDIQVQVISLTGMMRSFIKQPTGLATPTWKELK
jgi:prepilin-type N-terminal cleavage/methylation domain-containing protein